MENTNLAVDINMFRSVDTEHPFVHVGMILYSKKRNINTTMRRNTLFLSLLDPHLLAPIICLQVTGSRV